jgi:hypothetical protein
MDTGGVTTQELPGARGASACETARQHRRRRRCLGASRGGRGVYNLTKHGLGAFSESPREEITGRHVRVSFAEPGVRPTGQE